MSTGGTPISDRELRERLIEDPDQGWRLFIETHTATLLRIIEQCGVRREDEAMDVYVRVCEHLAADGCAKLRRHDPSKGVLAAWLTVVVRRVIVDWVRSRKGRRRLFQSIRSLDPLAREVFELYYWRGSAPAEIVEQLAGRPSTGLRASKPVGLADVFDALEAIEAALTARQRADLLSMAARVREPVALENEQGQMTIDPIDSGPGPEEALAGRQTNDALASALAELPAEDALIVSMRFIEGLSQAQVERALHIPLTAERIAAILARLRAVLERRGVADRTSATATFGG